MYYHYSIPKILFLCSFTSTTTLICRQWILLMTITMKHWMILRTTFHRWLDEWELRDSSGNSATDFGFYLMDVEKGLIMFEYLKRNSILLGLRDLRDDDLACMLMEGFLDGDGALNQMEFCILMFRLSPGLLGNHHVQSWIMLM